MNARAMNASLWGTGQAGSVVEAGEPQIRGVKPRLTWDRERFAQEQIRGLVRQVFSLESPRPVRQVVFSAIEGKTDVWSVCVRVGEALASEARGSVAVVGNHPRTGGGEEGFEPEPLQKNASTPRSNLWLIPTKENTADPKSISSVHSYLGEIRKQFEFSIVEGRPCGESDEAFDMARFADGIVLVISAEHTRRVTARKVLEMLHEARLRILGTVLSDREFPMPDRLYQWL
jgi:hypothetical protein